MKSNNKSNKVIMKSNNKCFPNQLKYFVTYCLRCSKFLIKFYVGTKWDLIHVIDQKRILLLLFIAFLDNDL